MCALACALLLVGCASTAAQTASKSTSSATEKIAGAEQVVSSPSTTPTIATSSSETPTTSSVAPQAEAFTPQDTSTTTAPSTSTAVSTSTITATSTTTSTSTTTNEPAAPSATLPGTVDQPAFVSVVSEIDDATAVRLEHSWREGCPVPLADLRLLTLTHWNFAGEAATGELVVHADYADRIVGVFATLYDAFFPIERMELVDVYEGDDDRSMAANNTSAFNCREVAWKPGVWSNHALGTAIDVNPLVNPYVSTTRVLPPEGAPFIDRTMETLGGLYAGDVATEAFAAIGWIWGGTWSSAKDWQHFSASGG